MPLLLLFLSLFLPIPALAAPLKLSVPYVSEVPDGQWIAPWKNACEEAAIIAVEQFYLGSTSLSKLRSKELMRPLFSWQDREFGSNKDTDAERTARIINEYSSFNASVERSPTLDQIKAELRAGHPAISLHYGFGLKNPRLRFRAQGSSFHMLVLSGFDDANQEFIVEDSGDYRGLDARYSYATILSTLHDFDQGEERANGPPTVLFTRPKELVKTPDRKTIYLLDNGRKRRITSPAVFSARRLSWKLVREIEPEALDETPTGQPL